MTTETPEAAAPPEAAPPKAIDEAIVQILASKILIDWLRNRQQLLVPLTLDLQKIEPAHAELLLHSMAAAVHADGTLDTSDRERLGAGLRLLNATDEQRTLVQAAVDQPRPLADVLAQVSDVQTGATVYAASLLALDRRKRVNRYYLRYLGARLQLSRDVMRSLEQRFTASN